MLIPSIDEAKSVLCHLPQRPDYTTWLNAISAIGNTYPEIEALSILLSHFEDEEPNEHKTKLKSRLKGINFGTLVYLAKQYGYNPQNSTFKTSYNDFKSNFDVLPVKKQKPFKFEGKPLLCYKFEDYEAEERSSILQYEAGMTREEADTLVFETFPNAERVYRIAVNERVLNKNQFPITRSEYPDYSVYTYEFQNKLMTCNEIAYAIGKGHSIIFCKLKEDSKFNCIKRNDSFEGSEIFAIDIDNEDPKTKRRLTSSEGYLPLEKVLQMKESREALMIYTTSNHTDSWNRYRIIFDLPRFIENQEHYRKLVNHYIKQFGSDVQCSDVARGYYGNDYASIYFPSKRTKIQFNKGVIC